MPCSMTERFVAGLLVAALAPAGCYYGDPKIVFKASRLEVQPSPPVHVADRLDLAMEGRTLVTRSTPLCADAQSGEYLVIKEEQREQRQSKGGSAAYLAIGAGELAAAYYTWGTDYQIASYFWLVGGALMAGLSLPALFLPQRSDTELPPERHPALTVATSGWQACGKPVPVSAPVSVSVTDGSYRWSFSGTTSADGLFSMPTDVDAWSSSCNVDLRVQVGFTSEATDRKILRERASRANVASLGPEHTTNAILQRHPVSAGGQLEVGDEARSTVTSSYPGQSSWQFRLPRPAVQVQPRASGGSEIAILARACRQQQKAAAEKRVAEARARCIAPIKEGVVAQCRATCVDAGKQQRCDVMREICVEQTAGVGGGLAQECALKLDQCLTTAGQSPSMVSGCTRKCENEAFDRQCPASGGAETVTVQNI